MWKRKASSAGYRCSTRGSWRMPTGVGYQWVWGVTVCMCVTPRLSAERRGVTTRYSLIHRLLYLQSADCSMQRWLFFLYDPWHGWCHRQNSSCRETETSFSFWSPNLEDGCIANSKAASNFVATDISHSNLINPTGLYVVAQITFMAGLEHRIDLLHSITSVKTYVTSVLWILCDQAFSLSNG